MKTSLVRIGNSRGIYNPKAFFEQYHLQDEVELEVKNDHLVIRSASEPRTCWEEAFQHMDKQGDDMLLDEEKIRSSLLAAGPMSKLVPEVRS